MNAITPILCWTAAALASAGYAVRVVAEHDRLVEEEEWASLSRRNRRSDSRQLAVFGEPRNGSAVPVEPLPRMASLAR